MKSTMWKTTFREIQQSFGRFMAIFAIVALGVGFFAGIKVAKPAMVKTTTDYLVEKNFFDYRLLSTLGFEEEDVAFFLTKPDVKEVEGVVNFDILLKDIYGNERAVKTHSITDNVNQLELQDGRMPTSPNECVIDSFNA